MANDAYPIAILASFAVHHYFPIIRDVAMQSNIVWVRRKGNISCTHIMYISCTYPIHMSNKKLSKNLIKYLPSLSLSFIIFIPNNKTHTHTHTASAEYHVRNSTCIRSRKTNPCSILQNRTNTILIPTLWSNNGWIHRWMWRCIPTNE